MQHLGKFDAVWNDVGEHWEGPAVYRIPIDTWLPSIMPTDNWLPSITVSGAGSRSVNGTYVFKEGEHENRHWGTIAGHYQHTNNPGIFIAFQDCGGTMDARSGTSGWSSRRSGSSMLRTLGEKSEFPRVMVSGKPSTVGKILARPAVNIRHLRSGTVNTRISSREKFEFIPVSEYDEVWNDRGSGANQDVSIWRVRVPHGCHLIGMTAKNGHSPPTHPTLVIRADGSQVAPPERFDLVWWQERGRRGSGAGGLSRHRDTFRSAMWGRLAKPRHQERRLFAFPRAASARAVSLWVVRFGTTEEEARRGTQRSLNSREARGSSDVVTMVPTTSLTESFQYLHIPGWSPHGPCDKWD